MSEPVIVVGIGADGWDGLTAEAQRAVRDADVLMGSERQLDLVPNASGKVRWPSPLLPALEGLLEEHKGKRICVLASGDPTYHGIGTTLARLTEVRVIPHVSSIALACARLNWPQEDVAVVRSAELLHPRLQPGRRILVLGSDGHTVMKILADHGYADSRVRVLERLGAPDEETREWSDPDQDPLNVVAVECRAEPGTALLTATPGLPDGVFENDGQLTKRDVRVIALSRLAPVPGQLLWDVGAGAGSIAIEWSRTHPSCRAIAVERDPERAARIGRNAAALGVPGVRVVEGPAPEALAGLEEPDAVFVGGGGSDARLVEACWDALKPGGRLVVSAVTIETETVLAASYAGKGGELVRVLVQHASALGGMNGWRSAMPVTIWSVTR